MPGPVALRPFTADLLGLVQPWFHHPEVQRRLGGPEWPAREFAGGGGDLGEIFRGRRVLLLPDTSAPDWEDIVHHIRRRG